MPYNIILYFRLAYFHVSNSALFSTWYFGIRSLYRRTLTFSIWKPLFLLITAISHLSLYYVYLPLAFNCEQDWVIVTHRCLLVLFYVLIHALNWTFIYLSPWGLVTSYGLAGPCFVVYHQSIPGPCLNIKTILSTYGDFHVKDKTAVRTSYL